MKDISRVIVITSCSLCMLISAVRGDYFVAILIGFLLSIVDLGN